MTRFLLTTLMLLLTTLPVFAQQRLLTGQVIDIDTQLPLPNATVALSGQAGATTTDEGGNFSISISGSPTLIVSYSGYSSETVEIGANQSSVIVSLVPAVAGMDEVVVIGYGTAVRRADLTGAVSSISSKDVKKIPAANVSQALQGNATGVYTLQSNRNPGADVSVNIRGTNSFSGTGALYVIDGFPVQGGTANVINPNDIESITVLKDASSTAIYGARAANGVILITTKTGKVGRVSVNAEVFRGVKVFRNPIEMMNAQQFAELRRDSYISDGNPRPDSDIFLNSELTHLNGGNSTNWWNEITNESASTESYQVSVSAGSEKTRLYMGAGLFRDMGIVRNSKYERGNLRINGIQKIGERLTLSTFNDLSLTMQTGSNSTNVLYSATVGNPLSPVYDETGQYYVMIQNALGTPRQNPRAFTDLQINKTMKPLINSSLSAEYKLADGLNLKTQISAEVDNYRQNFYNPRLISGQDEINGRISDGYASVFSSLNYSWVSETTINFLKTFNEIHNINAVAGFSSQKAHYENVGASASGFISDAYESYNLGVGTAPARKPSSNLEEWQMASYVGRAIYTLMDKYIFTGTIRVDGSSRFGANNKWGTFPSAAFAWKISEENFLNNSSWIDDLKLRLSYGITGNSGVISPYQTFSRLNYAAYNWNGLEFPGYYVSNMPSPDLKWETTRQFNAGVDLAVLNNRLNITFDHYRSRTHDLLRWFPISSVAGFTGVYRNLGILENKGVELGIRSVNFNGPLRWTTTFLLSRNTNKLVSLGDSTTQIGTEHWVGRPIGIGNRFMLNAIGVWQTSDKDEAERYGAQPGDVRYEDIDGNGIIDNNDRIFAGSYYAQYYGSITNDITYKNFDLNVFATYSIGRDVYNGNNYDLLSGAGAYNNRIEMINRWTPDNPSNSIPRASATASNRLANNSTEFLEDASFLKIRTITLGYQLPEQVASRINMANLRLYGTVYNPFTFTKFTGMDPEDGDYFNNSRNSSYPISTSFIIGIQLTL